MKKIYKVLAVILPVMMMAACTKDYTITIVTDMPQEESIVVAAGAPQTYKYNVASATGFATVTVTASNNISLTHIAASDGLSGTIIVSTSEYSADSYIQIEATNEGNTVSLRKEFEVEVIKNNASNNVANIVAEGGSAVLKLDANIEYQVTADASWLSFSPSTKAVSTHDIVVSAPYNEGVKRSCYVTVKSLLSGKSIVYKVNQDGMLHNLKITFGQREVVAPNLTGTNNSGTIVWGDGSTLDWQPNAKHTYNDSATKHYAEIHTQASGVEFTTLKGVAEVSFVEF